MIDAGLLRKCGWSEDLIRAAEKVAEEIRPPIEIVVDTDTVISSNSTMEGSSTVDLSQESEIVSTLPRF